MAWKNSTNDFLVKSNKWHGKKWVVLGDSNSTTAYANPYHQIIKDAIGVDVLNHAVGGAGWIRETSIMTQLSSTIVEADLITVMAGGNDYSVDYPLGQMGDTTKDTFYGALDSTIKAIIDKYPLKTVAVFTQMRRRNETVRPNGTSVPLQVQATIEVCKKYCIPVLDLYNHGNMYPWNDVWFAECMLEDGVHLKQKGHDILANKVKAFIETL
jgi:lysophospholipase L1-like esterase